MLRQVIAALLVVLTLTPFTAPFPTCDVTILFSDRAPAPPVHGTSPATSLADATLSQALPLVRPSGRVRFGALTEARTVSDGPALPAFALTRSSRTTTTNSQKVSFTILRI
jgi:hypothetical protein